MVALEIFPSTKSKIPVLSSEALTNMPELNDDKNMSHQCAHLNIISGKHRKNVKKEHNFFMFSPFLRTIGIEVVSTLFESLGCYSLFHPPAKPRMRVRVVLLPFSQYSGIVLQLQSSESTMHEAPNLKSTPQFKEHKQYNMKRNIFNPIKCIATEETRKKFYKTKIKIC